VRMLHDAVGDQGRRERIEREGASRSADSGSALGRAPSARTAPDESRRSSARVRARAIASPVALLRPCDESRRSSARARARYRHDPALLTLFLFFFHCRTQAAATHAWTGIAALRQCMRRGVKLPACAAKPGLCVQRQSRYTRWASATWSMTRHRWRCMRA